MDAQTLAARLNNRQYGNELTRDEEKLAKDAGLVVVFGYSDDNMELRGVIHDEVGCYNGDSFLIDSEGVMPTWDRGDTKDKEEAKEYFRRHNNPAKAEIEAVWDSEGYSWTYKTSLPHATFDILEGEEKFCRGIVFAIKDLYTR